MEEVVEAPVREAQLRVHKADFVPPVTGALCLPQHKVMRPFCVHCLPHR